MKSLGLGEVLCLTLTSISIRDQVFFIPLPEHLLIPSSSLFPWLCPSLTLSSPPPVSSDPLSNTPAGVILFPPFGERFSLSLFFFKLNLVV